MNVNFGILYPTATNFVKQQQNDTFYILFCFALINQLFLITIYVCIYVYTISLKLIG